MSWFPFHLEQFSKICTTIVVLFFSVIGIVERDSFARAPGITMRMRTSRYISFLVVWRNQRVEKYHQSRSFLADFSFFREKSAYVLSQPFWKMSCGRGDQVFFTFHNPQNTNLRCYKKVCMYGCTYGFFRASLKDVIFIGFWWNFGISLILW